MNARATALGTTTLLALALVGCSRTEEFNATSRAANDRAEHNAAVDALVHNYEQARAAKQWELALSYADQLHYKAPNSKLAQRVQATLVDTSIRADFAWDKRRLAGLWSYQFVGTNHDSDGVVASATILSDTDEKDSWAPEPARLVLRRHPAWGRSAYLVIDHGRFDCERTCVVQARFDDTAARPFAASKSDQNLQALYINDEQAIRDILDKIRVMTIDVSVDGKPRSLRFEVGGFDRVQLERQVR